MNARNYQLKGAFSGCRWCYGRGCNQCDHERAKWEADQMKPLFVAKRDDPNDMAALKRTFGLEALEKAFGPNGGGMQEIERNAAIESLLQAIRKADTPADTESPQ